MTTESPAAMVGPTHVMQFRCTRLNAWLRPDSCAEQSELADGVRTGSPQRKGAVKASHACCADCPIGAAHRKLGGKIMDGLHVRALPVVGSSPVPPPPTPKEAPPTLVQDSAKDPEPPVKGPKPSNKTRERVCGDCGAHFDGHWNAKRCGPCSASHVYPSAQRRSGGKVIPIAPKAAPDPEERGEATVFTMIQLFERAHGRRLPGDVASALAAGPETWGSYEQFRSRVLALLLDRATGSDAGHVTSAEPEAAQDGPRAERRVGRCQWTGPEVEALTGVLEWAGYELDEDVIIGPRGVVVLVTGKLAAREAAE